jgi:hypothetical protein
VGFNKPDALLEIPKEQWQDRCWGSDSDDMCQIDCQRCFIRCWLPLPVIGRANPFGWGVWVEISQPDLRIYWEHFTDPDQGRLEPFAGCIANGIVSYPDGTLGVAVSAQPIDDRTRPVVTVLDQDHVLWDEQRSGISQSRAMQFLHDYFGDRLPPG